MVATTISAILAEACRDGTEDDGEQLHRIPSQEYTKMVLIEEVSSTPQPVLHANELENPTITANSTSVGHFSDGADHQVTV